MSDRDTNKASGTDKPATARCVVPAGLRRQEVLT